MANEYPIRRDISQQGPSKVAPQPSAAKRAGSAVATNFERGAATGMDALGDSLRAVLGPVLGGAVQIAQVPSVRGAMNDFVEGATGATGAPKPKSAPKPVATDQATRSDPRRAAAVAGNVRPQMDLATEAVATILSRPWTLREGQAAVGMLPAPMKPQTNTDRAVGVGLDFAMSNYMNQIDTIRNSGVSAADQAKAEQSASKDLTNTLIAITRGNPMNLAGAGIYDQEGQ